MAIFKLIFAANKKPEILAGIYESKFGMGTCYVTITNTSSYANGQYLQSFTLRRGC